MRAADRKESAQGAAGRLSPVFSSAGSTARPSMRTTAPVMDTNRGSQAAEADRLTDSALNQKEPSMESKHEIPDDLKKQYQCSYLLPDPGGEVARELIERISSLESARKDQERDHRRLKEQLHAISVARSQIESLLTQSKHKSQLLEEANQRIEELLRIIDRLKRAAEFHDWADSPCARAIQKVLKEGGAA